jgi:hypothetical protein
MHIVYIFTYINQVYHFNSFRTVSKDKRNFSTMPHKKKATGILSGLLNCKTAKSNVFQFLKVKKI